MWPDQVSSPGFLALLHGPASQHVEEICIQSEQSLVRLLLLGKMDEQLVVLWHFQQYFSHMEPVSDNAWLEIIPTLVGFIPQTASLVGQCYSH